MLDESTRPFCTCGGEDCDGRGDVLDCPVHGIGPALRNVDDTRCHPKCGGVMEPIARRKKAA